MDIGCGAGAILIPASKIVKSTNGIDNSSSINRIETDWKKLKAELISEEFLDLINEIGEFDKIIVYGVVHCTNLKELGFHSAAPTSEIWWELVV